MLYQIRTGVQWRDLPGPAHAALGGIMMMIALIAMLATTIR